jgi:hypothetical protein
MQVKIFHKIFLKLSTLLQANPSFESQGQTDNTDACLVDMFGLEITSSYLKYHAIVFGVFLFLSKMRFAILRLGQITK